jgi:hypothetical protein
MSRGAQSFKQGDITKALKAAEKAGFRVGRFEIEPGKIVVFAGDTKILEAKPEPAADEWDGVQ